MKKYVLSQPDKFFVQKSSDFTYEEIKGCSVEVPIAAAYDLFSHKSVDDYDGGVTISEGKTGRKIAGGKSLKEAIHNTTCVIEHETNGNVDKLTQRINKHLARYGCTPRYRTEGAGT